MINEWSHLLKDRRNFTVEVTCSALHKVSDEIGVTDILTDRPYCELYKNKPTTKIYRKLGQISKTPDSLIID